MREEEGGVEVEVVLEGVLGEERGVVEEVEVEGEGGV